MRHQPTPPPGAPRHVAVIMDGNGRWAQSRGRPRAFGHQAGVRAARRIVRAAHDAGVKVLTVFAFSQENWQRPASEVSLLMQLFVRTLAREIDRMHRNGIRLRFIGDHSDFAPELRAEMQRAETLTAANRELTLVVAVGYGGQWDVVQAAQAAAAAAAAGGPPLSAETLEQRLAVADLPHPDLLIRTGGERRISNFLLWQIAYSELYFSDTLWPDFGGEEFAQAVAWYASRQRRFGRVPEAG